MTALQTAQGASIGLGPLLAGGGEADIYEISQRPQLVAKVYHEDKRTRERRAKIEHMMKDPPTEPTTDHISFAWPQRLLLNPQGKFAGFVMPRASGMQLSSIVNPRQRQSVSTDITWQYLLRIARNIATVTAALHDRGYVIGDLGEQNFHVTSSALVTVVDCDSMQVPGPDGDVFLCEVGVDRFTAPEFVGKDFSSIRRTPESDDFALAVLVFLLLLDGVHPYQGQLMGPGDLTHTSEFIRRALYAFDPNSKHIKPPPWALPLRTVPPSIESLFSKAFILGHLAPARRPTARQWQVAIAEVEGNLKTCSTESNHVYSNHLLACPWCERRKRLHVDPFAEPAPDVYATEGRMVDRSGAPAKVGFFRRLAHWLRRLFRGKRTSPSKGPTTIASQTRRPSPMPAPGPPTQAKSIQVVANKMSLKYHRPNCKWAVTMSHRNRRNMLSVEAAKRGLSPCLVCRPPR